MAKKRKHTITATREWCRGILNGEVFRDLQFSENDMRDIIYDSYVMNLDNMILYAADNGIRVRPYFKEIQKILLQLNGVSIRER